MSYAQITSLIFQILSGILGIFTIHFIIFGIVGIFKYKKFPKAKVQHKYGAIIPARNEEAVVGNLIKSIQKSKYPQELLHIFVIAHNCTDRTAQICRELGATVYEYNNPKENTMGYAFKHLFDCINRDYGTQNYDGFFLFNADNIVDKDYFDKMNDAFEAGECKNVVTSFRNSKNFGSNLLSGLYGMLFITNCRFECRGRTVLGCSTRVQGTGYVIPSEIVVNGWPYVTLTEDWEFSADQVLQGRKIVYNDEAMFYDEQPTSLRVMVRQRLRWSKGHLLVCLTRGKALFKSLFRRKCKGGGEDTFSKYDIFVNIMPFAVVSGMLAVISFIMSMLTPIFDGNAAGFFTSFAISTAAGLLLGYLGMVLWAGLTFILERKRIKNVSVWNKIGVSLLWPIFVILNFPLEFAAMCAKNIGWKAIPHTDTTNFEALNEEQSIELKPSGVKKAKKHKVVVRDKIN